MKVSFHQEELELTLEQEFKFFEFKVFISKKNNLPKIVFFINKFANNIKIQELILSNNSDFQITNESKAFKLETEKDLSNVLKMTLEGKKQFFLTQLKYSLWLGKKYSMSIKIK